MTMIYRSKMLSDDYPRAFSLKILVFKFPMGSAIYDRSSFFHVPLERACGLVFFFVFLYFVGFLVVGHKNIFFKFGKGIETESAE